MIVQMIPPCGEFQSRDYDDEYFILAESDSKEKADGYDIVTAVQFQRRVRKYSPNENVLPCDCEYA